MVKAAEAVAVHYRCALDGGTIVDASHGVAPLSLPLSGGAMLPAFLEALAALKAPGATAEVRIEAADAYGPRRDDLVFAVPAAVAPRGLVRGQRVRLGRAPAMVSVVRDDVVTVDANHPLAGQALRFEIELAEHADREFSPYAFIAQAPWRFARTMPHIPHWYTVRGQTPEDEFETCVRYIRAHGYLGTYRGPRNSGRTSRNIYLMVAHWKYWTMGAPVEETTIINRAAIHPRTPWVWEPIEADVEKLTAEEVPAQR